MDKKSSYDGLVYTPNKMQSWYNDKTAPYIDYLATNFGQICKEIDEEFEKRRPEIAEKLSDMLTSTLDNGNLTHYEWYQDGCDWDDSGDIRAEGSVDLDQTVEEFLRDERTGEWTATYESHHGRYFDSYGDAFSYDTLGMGEEIMWDVIHRRLTSMFPDGQWKDQDIHRGIENEMHDPFYDETRTRDFFFGDVAFDFAGLLDKPLSDFVDAVPGYNTAEYRGCLKLVVDHTKPSES